MEPKLKYYIYLITAVSIAAAVYLLYKSSPWLASAATYLGYKLTDEIYKLDRFKNPRHYKKPDKQ